MIKENDFDKDFFFWNATALFNIGNATATKETEASETHKEATTSATA